MYAPDIPGCISMGKDLDDIRRMMREAIVSHIKGLKLDGETIPTPTTEAAFFSIDDGVVKDESKVERLYDIKRFASKARITTSTARVYAHRFGIGRKMGRGWVLTDEDLRALPSANA